MVSSLTVCGGKTICSPTPGPFPNPRLNPFRRYFPRQDVLCGIASAERVSPALERADRW